MSLQMSVPFALAPDGTISVETNPDRQISQRVVTVVSTTPGERVMNLNFGVPLHDFVFEGIDSDTESRIAQMVTTALATYEPGVRVRVVKPTLSANQDSVLGVEVDFQRTDSPTSPLAIAKRVNTAIIKIGGTVEEVIRG